MKRAIRRPINFKQQSFETLYFFFKQKMCIQKSRQIINYVLQTSEFLTDSNSEGENSFLCQKLERGTPALCLSEVQKAEG